MTNVKGSRLLCSGLILSLFVNVIFVVIYAFYFNRELTLYGRGYSEEKFNDITCKMSEDDVRDMLGQPILIIEEDEDSRQIRKVDLLNDGEVIFPTTGIDESNYMRVPVNFIIWFYSKQGGPTKDWKVRAITFDSNRQVYNVYSSYYVD